MEKNVDAKMLSELLDAAQARLDDVGEEMRRLLDEVERTVLPQEEALQALQSSLGEIASMRTELLSKGAGIAEELPASGAIAEWRRSLAAYEEKCAHTAEREALLLLQRLYSEDAECQAAIESFRAGIPSWDAAVLGRKKPELLAGIKLLMEAFQEEKPMTPPRKIVRYTLKLKDFPEILISAVTLDDPPLLLQEQKDEAAREEAASEEAAEAGKL